jgi:hypothetical protein
MGIDPAYGSSAFGIVVTQWVDNHIQILHAEEYHRPDYNEMLATVYGLISSYDVETKCILTVLILLLSNPSKFRQVKTRIMIK